MDVPTRHVETRWGALYASAPDAGQVRFGTDPPTPGDAVRPLTIHRLQYSCYLDVSQAEPKPRGRVHIDDIWHFDPHVAITNLRRHPDGGAPTMTAQTTLQRDIIPSLTQWLYSPDGVSLLQDSSQYQRALRAEQHASTERLLQDAIDRVRHLAAPIMAGLTIDPADERFLGYLNTDFRHALQGEATAAAASHEPRSTNADPGPSYEARCRLAATSQGLDLIIERLNAEGIPHSVEQTGGWVMVIEIPVADRTYIGVTADAVQPDHWVVVRYADPDAVGEPLIPSHGFEVPAETALAAIHQQLGNTTQSVHPSPLDDLRRRLDSPPGSEPPGPCL